MNDTLRRGTAHTYVCMCTAPRDRRRGREKGRKGKTTAKHRLTFYEWEIRDLRRGLGGDDSHDVVARRPDFRQKLHRDKYHRLRRATMMRTNARRTVPYRPAAHTPYGHYAAKITNYGSGGKNRTLGPSSACWEPREQRSAIWSDADTLGDRASWGKVIYYHVDTLRWLLESYSRRGSWRGSSNTDTKSTDEIARREWKYLLNHQLISGIRLQCNNEYWRNL